MLETKDSSLCENSNGFVGAKRKKEEVQGRSAPCRGDPACLRGGSALCSREARLSGQGLRPPHTQRVQPPLRPIYFLPKRALGEQRMPSEHEPVSMGAEIYCPHGTPLRLKGKPFKLQESTDVGWLSAGRARKGMVSLPAGLSTGGLRLRPTSRQGLGSRSHGNVPPGCGACSGQAACCPAATGFISCGVKGAIHSLTRMSGEEPGREPRLDGSWVPGTLRG